MSAPGKVLKVLSSPALLVWLVLGWVLYYVTLATWGEEAFGVFVVSLGRSAVVISLYLLFLLCLLLNIVRAARRRLLCHGALHAALWAVLPVGVLIFLLGFFISSTLRSSEWAMVGEGQSLRPAWSGQTLLVGRIDPALKRETLGAEAGGTVFEYEPSVVLSTESGREHRVGAFPPTRIEGTYYHILNFGLAPGISLAKDGRVLDGGYMPVRILPPGMRDEFRIKPLPYRFVISIAPARLARKGTKTVKLYDLREMDYMLKVIMAERVIFEGRTGEGVSFDGYELAIGAPRYWVVLDMARNRGVPLLIAGLVTSLAGLLLVPAWALFARRKGNG